MCPLPRSSHTHGPSCPTHHIGGFFRSSNEQQSGAIQFLVDGLRKKEKLFYVFDGGSPEEASSRLQANGLPANVATQVVFVNYREAFLNSGKLSPEDLTRYWIDQLTAARQQGFCCIRVAADASWLSRETNQTQAAFAASENRGNDVIAEHGISALCQYDVNLFSPAVLMDVLHGHPMVMLNGEVLSNPYYAPKGLPPVRAADLKTFLSHLEHIKLQSASRQLTQNQPEAPDFKLRRLTGKALVVDDEEEIRMILSTYLRRFGLQVIEARDGREALEKFKTEHFDYVLTDIQMPQMDGETFLREARKLAATGCRFIVVTGSVGVPGGTPALQALVDANVEKPFDKNAIFLALTGEKR